MGDRSVETQELPWYRGPAFLLLVVLMTVYAMGTFLRSHGWGAHLVNVLLVVSLILGVRKITNSKKALAAAVLIVVIGIAGEVLVDQITGRHPIVWSTSVNLIFFGAVLVFLIVAVVRAERVDADTVFASAAVFMLIGLVWAYAFVLVHLGNPAAFSLQPEDLDSPVSALIHYSFTTLTTVGYGSISPMSKTARMLSDLEAFIAQIYLAVVVARLVSLQIEHSRKNSS